MPSGDGVKYSNWPPESWETGASANPDVGQVASGHASVTGTATISTGLGNAIQTCVASLQAVSAAAFSVSCAPSGTGGSITLNVYTDTGVLSTTPVVVHWFASDQE